jgi:hypothetical protein
MRSGCDESAVAEYGRQLDQPLVHKSWAVIL